MADFDLSHALSCSPRDDCNLFDKETFKLDDELDLVVSYNQKTMKHVAYLVLAVNKMNKFLSQSGDLGDDELCNAILDCVAEETVVDRDHKFCRGERQILFQRSNSRRSFTLCDMHQKDLILNPALKLEAITLRAGYCDRKVKFEICRYSPTCDLSTDSVAVLLSVSKDLHISCSMTDNKVVLNLEECSDENLMEICKNLDMDRFLFLKRASEKCLATFESVKYRGWFISTSYDDRNCSVEMCQEEAMCQTDAPRVNRFKCIEQN